MRNVKIRIAHRLKALRDLPYLIVLNPNISQIYSIYYNSFTIVCGAEPPRTLEENLKLVQILEQLVEAHSNTIPILARGFHESRGYISVEESSEVLDSHLRARIGTRLLAEHHIALTNPIDENSFIGAVQMNCSPSQILTETAEFVGGVTDLKFGTKPAVLIDQGSDIKLPYIPVHLEYIFTELLKNSFRASVEKAQETGEQPETVLVTFIRTDEDLIVRMRDRGGGIPPELEKDVFGYSFSTFESNEGDGFTTLNAAPGGASTLAGMGYGLPLSKAYAEFFGGSLRIQSYYGWGIDVYVTLHSPRHLIKSLR